MHRSATSCALFLIASLATAASPTHSDDAFEVLVSEPWTVHSSPAGGGTSMLKLANGEIVNQYWEGDGGHPYYALISSDKGKTWTRTTWPGDSACVAALSDGT